MPIKKQIHSIRFLVLMNAKELEKFYYMLMEEDTTSP